MFNTRFRKHVRLVDGHQTGQVGFSPSTLAFPTLKIENLSVKAKSLEIAAI